ncbi:SUPPRESSOR OF ABI3-5 isoform X1 [Olea europaea subsp. europaea]|uniref:SUPPRESSOR OF ABI3-5 isoform X1 n=1 Tax=Olea europaea subsp. europaea TaxID=158383 RepID=A0A8S0TVI3_OLEEU|nr:SUPPRESSOR OF ABI3-5 isoform X1 [Olea europaea subsp. europaea]
MMFPKDKLGEWTFKSRSRDAFHEGYMFPMLVAEEFDVYRRKMSIGEYGAWEKMEGNQPKKLDPKLEVQAGDSYKAVIQKKAIAQFREIS